MSRKRKKRETAALLIDGNNVSGCLTNKRLNIDELFSYLVERGYDIVHAEYHLAVNKIKMDEELSRRHKSFHDMLVLKDVQVLEKDMRPSGEGWKGDCDMRLAFACADAILKRDVQWVVVMTNDSDFTDLIDWVHRQARKVAILSIDGDAAIELRNDADVYEDLSGVSKIFMTPRRRRKRGRKSGDTSSESGA